MDRWPVSAMGIKRERTATGVAKQGAERPALWSEAHSRSMTGI